MLGPWWEVWPGRLEHELEALGAAGIPAVIDDEARRRGVIKIDFRYTASDGGVYPMVALFPDLYPYFRFQIYAPTLSLSHHQNPVDKNLCLLGRDSRHWRPSDTLAAFIKDRERLPAVLKAGEAQDREEVATLEEHQAEPRSVFYRYADDAMFIIDSAWMIDRELPGGEIVIGLQREPTASGEPLRGAVLKVLGPEGALIAEADQSWPRLYPWQTRGRWVRMDSLPATNNAQDILAALESGQQRAALPSGRRVGELTLAVLAVLFPEERAWRELGTGWMFLASVADKWHRYPKPILVRASRAGRDDFAARRPELSPLESKRITVFGVGGVGAPSVLEFARAGVGELRLVDDDVFEPGTAVRWPLGLHEGGYAKVDALKTFIDKNYPYTKVAAYKHRLGAEGGRPQSDTDLLREVLDQTDLIYDSSAELGVQYFLSALARTVEIPCVSVSTTRGAWGGVVARIRPDVEAGCWVCLQHHQQDVGIPMPPENAAGAVQPVGCAAPTYIGAGFDVTYIALAGVRVAVATLLGKTNPAYDLPWDVAVISLRGDDGRVAAPAWITTPLTRHLKCPHHS